MLEAVRWGLCFALVLFFHVAGVIALMARWSADGDLVANAPVIMIDLAPVPAAPQTQPNELPPDIVESNIAEPEPEPLREEKPLIELPQQPKAELPVMPPPKPVEKQKEKPKQKRASFASVAQSDRAGELEIGAGRTDRTPQASSRRCARPWSGGCVLQCRSQRRPS
jgi:hypothetical protein